MIRPLVLALAAFLSIPAAPAPVAAAPPEDHKPSFPIEAEAEAFVARRPRQELLQDDVFVAALVELAKSGLPPRSQADAFALMQERIGWLFAGTARLFPKMGYAQTQAMILSAYFQYQGKMPSGLDVGPLLAFAEAARNDHPLRASNALLLATILNRGAAIDAVRLAIDPKKIAATPVPAIDLHNVSLAAALTGEPKIVSILVDLLPHTSSEESREDILAATGIYRIDEIRDKVEAFVRETFPASFDRSVKTALMVLVHGSEQGHFRDFYKSLAKDPASIKTLRDYWDAKFPDSLQSDDPAKQPLKIWDGFTVTVENEGAWVRFGETYRYWVTFK